MKYKDQIKKGDRIYFNSGNFVFNYGTIINVDWYSKDKRAIFGFLHTVKLDDNRIVYIEKSEHWDYEDTSN